MTTKTLQSYVDEAEIASLQEFLFSLPRPEPTPISLQNDILLAFERHLVLSRGVREAARQYLDKQTPEELPPENMHSSRRFLNRIQEILHLDSHLILVYRNRRAYRRVYRLDRDSTVLQRLAIEEFLACKEELVKPGLPQDHHTLDINMAPFYDYGPSLKDPDTIGDGIKHLNRYMSANLSRQPEEWTKMLYEFLKLHQMHDRQLLLDGNTIKSVAELESALEDVVDYLERCDCPEDLPKISRKLAALGFLEGWGDNAGRILETIMLLQDVLEQPNGEILEEFLFRIPMVSKVALISPHGWFGQENVLGRPDTGGQVVYILDQARALEQFLKDNLRLAGLDIEPQIIIVTRLIPEHEGTTANQRLEPVFQTSKVTILRVPFRHHNDEIVPHWISRFRIWPYLDRFAGDVRAELLTEFGSRPDLIVGNYSDGNLVASLLSKSLGVIQCNIAHALEKSKYLFSDLFWENFENEYNFSLQFSADLIAMNLANFIITSTRQEITGTDHAIGQYESYQFFTMPGLMQVNSGINLFHPRFNVIPPGVSQEIFFPFSERQRRRREQTDGLEDFLFHYQGPECAGRLDRPELPPIFTIARLDRIKNLTGLVEAYGLDPELQARANIILIASSVDPALSRDDEEAAEIRKMHEIINRYDLHGKVRWIGKLLSKEDTGEAYRIIADHQGVFVQPALFEAFGLTIIEAMHSGLPVFATEFGGPQEIIHDDVSGFLINPTVPAAMTGRISAFFESCRNDPDHWQKYSNQGLERANSRFTWSLYCDRLIRLTKVYGFWKYAASGKAKSRMVQYCDLLYQLFYKPRAEKIIDE